MSRREVTMEEYWCEYRREDAWTCERAVKVPKGYGLPPGWIDFSGSTFCGAEHFAAHLRTLTPKVGLLDGTILRERRYPMEAFIGRIDPAFDSDSRIDLSRLASQPRASESAVPA